MKVIFVDDSTIVLETLKSMVLEMMESKVIRCEFFNNSLTVKYMIENETLDYDLMFVDINMPNVTGYELAESAKKIQKYKYKSIIAITSEYTEESKTLGKNAGIDGWFIKSIEQDSIHTSISDAIKQLHNGLKDL